MVSLRSRVASSLVGLLLVSVGCQDRLCRDVGLDPNGRYELTMLEVYDAQSSFKFESVVSGRGWSSGLSMGRCGGMDGLSPTTTVALQATGTVDNDTQNCKLITANLVSTTGAFTPLRHSTDPGVLAHVRRAGDPPLYGAEDVTAGGCSGSLAFALMGGGASGGILSAPTPGQLPPAIFYAIFLPTSGDCLPCDDNFAVQVARK